MPALTLFGRQHSLGSDDFTLPALLAGLIRAGFLVCLVAASSTLQAVVHDESLECDFPVGKSVEESLQEMRHLRSFCYAFGLVSVLSFLLFSTLLIHSLRGSIVDDQTRRHVVPLLKVCTVVLVAEGLMNLYGTMYAWRFYPTNCAGHPGLGNTILGARVVTIVVWTNVLLFFLCGHLTVSNKRVVYENFQYERIGEGADDESGEQGTRLNLYSHASDDEGMSWSVTRVDWEKRCRRWCCVFQLLTCNVMGCSATQASDETFRSVANVMARFFKGMDVVPSDLIASLLLLRAEQRAQETAAVQALVRQKAANHRNGEDGACGTDSLRSNAQRDSCDPDAAPSFHSWLWSDSQIALRAETKLRVSQFRRSRTPLDDDARELLFEAQHFAPYMLGIYGKWLFTYMNLATGPCSLVCPWLMHTTTGGEKGERRRLNRRPSFDDNIVADDCCGFNQTALRVQTREQEFSSIVFANWHNKVHETPYSIAVDRESETVVLCIRGTLSASDMLVDAIVTPKPLGPSAAKWGFRNFVDEESHTHGGMLITADYIRTDIERRQILHRLLFGTEDAARSHYGSCGPDSQRAAQQRDNLVYSHDLDSLPDCRGYKLKIVGHSLGAGVSVILSLMLKPLVPGLTVIAYSPPGCMFDLALARRSEAWIHSIFVGSDMIPHASWRSLLKLRGQMLECLRRSKANKSTTMRSAVTNTHADDLLYPEEAVPNTFARQQLALKIKRLQAQAEGNDFLSKTPMFCPGKIVHCVRTETHQKGCCRTEETFVPVIVSDRRTLDEFVVSRNMALDHFPNTMAAIVDQVAKEYAADVSLDALHVV